MKFRFSGHETFVCRYPWLPKAVKAVSETPGVFSNEDEAMVTLGVGKNMVRSIRFWAEAMNIIEGDSEKGFHVSDFGNAIFGPKGFDPFLEDERTLWLLHWKLSTRIDEPLFAWNFLLNNWHEPELTRTDILRTITKLPELVELKLSNVTIEEHLDVFFRTYFPTRGKKGEVKEDNLDSPFLELRLLEKIGDCSGRDGHSQVEPVFSFRREEKPEIDCVLFSYALNDFFETRFPKEKTLPFKEVAFGIGSPGQIFKLPEKEVRERLEQMNSQENALFGFSESSVLQQIHKKKSISSLALVKQVYQPKYLNVKGLNMENWANIVSIGNGKRL